MLFANAGGKGYYRTSYSEAAYRDLLSHVETSLTPEERISLLGDQWALMRAGKADVGAYLSLVAAVRKDASAEVLDQAVANLYRINSRIIASEATRQHFAAWVRTTFGETYQSIREAKADDTPNRREARAQLLGLMSDLGDDAEAKADARRIAEQSLADPASVDATLSETAVDVAARHGDAKFFDQLQKLSTDAANPQTRSSALYSLALFTDPSLEERALDYAVSGKVKNQSSAGLISLELRGRDTREVAWKYIQQHWDKVQSQITESSGAGIVGAAGSFCSEERKQEVAGFFTAHKVPASERTLAIAQDQIRDCVDLRAAQGAKLDEWLARQ
jgi:aminopeptidase N/puromycin-sensitive aminopeptidase